MKLLWFLLVIFLTINASQATNKIDVSKQDAKKSDLQKNINPSSSITTKPRSMYLLNIPDTKRKFVVNLKPKKTESQIPKPEKNSNRLMKKLPIKSVNYNGNAKIHEESTTRRALMQIRRFTVKPHDIYAESIREKYGFNGNRKINNNFRKSTSERYTNKRVKPNNEEDSSEQRFLTLTNNSDSEKIGKQGKHNYFAAASQKIKTILRFPKINNTKHFNVKFEPAHENKSVPLDTILSDVINQNHDVEITEDKKKIIVSTTTEPKDMNPESIDIKSELEDMKPQSKEINSVPKDVKSEPKDIKSETKDIKPETKDTIFSEEI